jgi:hypothetical protein
VLRTKNDVKTLFSSKAENSETKFYLSNSIDAENVTVYPRAKFAATLEGNGYTISNLTLQSTLSQTSVSALFGNIQETATIKDITFADLTVTYNSRPNMGIGDEYQNQHNEKWTHGYEAYLVYATRAMGSVVENVVINGNMTVSIGDYTCVHNLWDETTQSFVEQNWMFGDGDSTGFTVNATLEIKARWWNGNN